MFAPLTASVPYEKVRLVMGELVECQSPVSFENESILPDAQLDGEGDEKSLSQQHCVAVTEEACVEG